MTQRTTTRTVTFAAPFTLPGWDEMWPAEPYQVTTDEEQLDTSFPAFRRVATRIALRRGPETRSVPVDPADLEHALAGDGTTAAAPESADSPHRPEPRRSARKE